MAKTTTRSRTATIRFSPENLSAAEKVAALTGRTVSSLAEYALVLFMRQNYPLAYNHDAVLVLKLDEAPKLTAHTDHPLRHFDRTCPGCADENA